MTCDPRVTRLGDGVDLLVVTPPRGHRVDRLRVTVTDADGNEARAADLPDGAPYLSVPCAPGERYSIDYAAHYVE